MLNMFYKFFTIPFEEKGTLNDLILMAEPLEKDYDNYMIFNSEILFEWIDAGLIAQVDHKDYFMRYDCFSATKYNSDDLKDHMKLTFYHEDSIDCIAYVPLHLFNSWITSKGIIAI